MIQRFVFTAVILAAASLHAQEPAIKVEKNLKVAMRDGVKLATDVYTSRHQDL